MRLIEAGWDFLSIEAICLWRPVSGERATEVEDCDVHCLCGFPEHLVGQWVVNTSPLAAGHFWSLLYCVAVVYFLQNCFKRCCHPCVPILGLACWSILGLCYWNKLIKEELIPSSFFARKPGCQPFSTTHWPFSELSVHKRWYTIVPVETWREKHKHKGTGNCRYWWFRHGFIAVLSAFSVCLWTSWLGQLPPCIDVITIELLGTKNLLLLHWFLVLCFKTGEITMEETGRVLVSRDYCPG